MLPKRLVAASVTRSNFACDSDTLVLEDETGRVSISSKTHPLLKHNGNKLVTGIVVAVIGQMTSDMFYVEEIEFPCLAPQENLPNSCCVSNTHDSASLSRTSSLSRRTRLDNYIGIFGGLRIGASSFNPLTTQMLLDYIIGNIGSRSEQSFASHVVRVIVAGNCVCSPEERTSNIDIRGQCIAPREQQSLVSPMKFFDSMINQLSKSVEIDIMYCIFLCIPLVFE